MIPAKKRELERAFRKHMHAFRSVTGSHVNFSYKLLLFYAIECGLKVLLLKEIDKNSTEDILKHGILGEKLKGANGHNIKYMLSYLNCGQFVLPHLECKNQSQASPRDYNQVWRYGIEVEPDKEGAIIAELKKIAEWIEGRI